MDLARTTHLCANVSKPLNSVCGLAPWVKEPYLGTTVTGVRKQFFESGTAPVQVHI